MHGLPHDRGPIYLETVMGRFPVEPWNTASNLLFLALIIYWTWRLRRDGVGPHSFIAGALPVLFIGWVGGTIYHATRSANIWLFLDIGPIALLVIATAVFFWRRVRLASFWIPLIVLGPTVLVMGGVSTLGLPRVMGPMIGYPMMAVSLLLPLLWNLRREGWANLGLVLAALAVFVLAVLSRSFDARLSADLLPMGTHWLWHSLGAGAVQLLVTYIWRSDLRQAALVNR
jgi:hypothetical protein